MNTILNNINANKRIPARLETCDIGARHQPYISGDKGIDFNRTQLIN